MFVSHSSFFRPKACEMTAPGNARGYGCKTGQAKGLKERISQAFGLMVIATATQGGVALLLALGWYLAGLWPETPRFDGRFTSGGCLKRWLTPCRSPENFGAHLSCGPRGLVQPVDLRFPGLATDGGGADGHGDMLGKWVLPIVRQRPHHGWNMILRGL